MAKMTPSAFISSTKEDLDLYRTAAKDAAIQAGFQPVMMDTFAAQSEQPPYPACMAKVDPCDVVVVIVAHRYGWVPPDQPGRKDRSITWLECDHALKKKHKAEVLAFVVDEKCNWPHEFSEAYRATKAFEDGTFTTNLGAEIQRNVGKLKEFKQWLNSIGFRGHFTAPDNLKSQVLAALYEWRDRHPQFRLAPGSLQQDPAQYLSWLREQTAWIDIRGLQVGSGKANRFPIGDLYIPLKTTGGEAEHLAGRTKHEISGDLRESLLLEEALRHRRLVITGDPGSGKTTFLRRIAYELSRDVGQRALQLPQDGFPLLIRIAELEECIGNCHARHQAGAPNTKESPAWLAYFLEYRAQEWKWKLDTEFFEAKLSEKSTLVLLDGLDEAANQANRESMARLLENATQAYPNCQFVVTTRPGSYQGLATLEGFDRVMIDDLQTEGIERFLHHWSQGLYPSDPGGADRHCKELLGALRARIEIRRMARNPVMLTALAVVHWNEKRLPEQRADLYDSIVTWLARSRQQRPGRERPERCLSLLGRLALAMQNQPQGRLVQVSLGQAAKMIAAEFHEIAPQERFAHAQAFLRQEEDDSGMVVSRGSELRFWHLTFQEFLAARAISGLEEASQQELLLSEGKLYRAEWREVVLLLAGILLVKQGQDKVNGLFRAVLNQLGTQTSLAQTSLAHQAQCTGLLGAVLADLRPLAFQPIDPRYPTTLEAVLGIFDATKAKDIDLQVRLEAAEALGQAGDPRLRADHDNWITIPAGSFLMGAQQQDSTQPNYDSEADEDESPVHEVRLAAFQVSRYPVTVEEYRRFMEDDGYQKQTWWKGGGFGERNQPNEWDDQLLHLNRPVVNVTWYEASAWCAWAGVRLLREAEWEWAARGLEGRKYPWGNQELDPEHANYEETKLDHPSPVGLFPRGMTPEGIHDLVGNVWEWVEDWYDEKYYAKSPSVNPTGPASGQQRVVRGGSWDYESRFLRSSLRNWYVPVNWYGDVGFRCAREVFP
jgi:formylglycine-generating enzyme required for sulfatase activity